MLYGYVDYTLENEPRPFYVGIGNFSRVKSKQRNRDHTNVVKQFGGFIRVVEFECVSNVLLEAWEVGTTAAYHTYKHDRLYNGIGCNLVKGGHRNTGRVDSPEVRQKRGRAVSRAIKGKSYPHPSLRGRKRPPRTQEWNLHLSAALRGKPRPGARKPKSELTKAKMSKAAMGNQNGRGNKGGLRPGVIHHCSICGNSGHDIRTCTGSDL